MFDRDGTCLDQPAERDKTTFKDRVRARAGQAQELGGLVWVYVGPEPAPAAAALRRLRDGRRPRHRLRRLCPATGCRSWRTPSTRTTSSGCTAATSSSSATGGLRGPQVVPAAARQGRLRRVRVRHHQAPRAGGPQRGRRRLGDRAPAGVPVQHAGRRRGHRADADPGADRRHHHLVHALHGARPRRRPGPGPGRHPRLRASLARRARQPHHRLRRGPGHHGLGHPGPDHRPDHRAPGQVRRRRRHAAQDVQAADGRGRRRPRPARRGPRPDRTTASTCPARRTSSAPGPTSPSSG